MRFGVSSLCCSLLFATHCFAYPVIHNGSMVDATFKQVAYNHIPDAPLVNAILTQSNSLELHTLYEQLQYLCITCDEDWRDFISQLEANIARNNSQSILATTITVKGQLKKILTPFLSEAQANQPTTQMSIVSAIFLYTISYLPPDEIKQLSLGYTGNLQEKFDDYACAFIQPSSQEQRPAVKKEVKNTSNAR